jgi:hypothetical protein
MEWNYSMLYMYMNLEEVQPYFEKFDKTYYTYCEQPTFKQLDHMREHGLYSDKIVEGYPVPNTKVGMGNRMLMFVRML